MGWEVKEPINEAQQIAAEKHMNWVVNTIIKGNKHFDGLHWHSHVMNSTIEVYSQQLGVLYKAEPTDVAGEYNVIVFHPGPWVDRAVVEAERLEQAEWEKQQVNYTPVDF